MTHSRTMTDILSLADADREIVNWVLKQQRSTLDQISQHTQKSSDDLKLTLTQLVSEGFLSEDAETGNYQIAVRTKPRRPSAEKLWDTISD
ncbi:MAG: hypothetical protein AAF716_04305 [Cyanobacteria bacterium P01_D01_bin.1]